MQKVEQDFIPLVKSIFVAIISIVIVGLLWVQTFVNTKVNKVVPVLRTIIVTPTVAPSATPSATLAPFKAFKSVPVVPSK